MLIFLLACVADPPSATSISPTTGAAGTEVTVSGANFVDGMTVQLGKQPLAALAVVDANTATGAVPAGLSPGPANLIVTSADGLGMTLSKAFSVRTPEPEDPCGSEIQRMTQIPADGSVVKIDRHLPGGEIDRIVLKAREIKAVEYEETTIEADGICRAVYLRTRSDQRHLFDASSTEDLRWQAQRIAGGLGKPLEVGATMSADAAEE